MKNKGFVLMETIVVIVVISIALLTIFSSYNKILTKVKTENKYDTSEYIYMTKYIKDNIGTYSAQNINNSITNYANNNILKDLYGVEKIYFLTCLNGDDSNKSFCGNNNEGFSKNEYKLDAYMIDYIRKLDVKDIDKLIIVEYKKLSRDNNYSPVQKNSGTNYTDDQCDENKCLYETYIASLEW